MATFKLNKLVRNKLIEMQLALGEKPHYRVLKGKEMRDALLSKIIEETKETQAKKGASISSEIADIQQAIDDLVDQAGLTKEEIAIQQELKNIEKGSFSKGYFVETIDLEENDKWTKYYRTDPDRFPEIKK